MFETLQSINLAGVLLSIKSSAVLVIRRAYVYSDQDSSKAHFKEAAISSTLHTELRNSFTGRTLESPNPLDFYLLCCLMI